MCAQPSCRGGPGGPDRAHGKVLRPDPVIGARNVKAFSHRPTCMAAEAPEAKMWVIKICDERNEM